MDQAIVTDELGLALRRGIRRAAHSGKPVIVSVAQKISAFEPLEILERGAQLTNTRAYWAQPDGELTLVGLGVVHAIDTVESLRFRQAAADWRYVLADAIVEGSRGLPGVGPLLLGGFSFDALQPRTALWKHFPAARLILPKLLFTKTKNEFWLTCTARVEPDSDTMFEELALHELVDEVCEERDPTAAAYRNPGAMRMRELVSAREWQTIVADAIQTIRRGDLEKIVLARAVQLDASAPFCAERALRHFAQHAPGTYQFAFVRGDDCFLGATPEQLVRVRAGQAETMGLAGSIPRGATPEQDKELGNELLASAKDRNEQEIVVRAMREVLGDTCIQLQMSETPSLLKLGSIQHLVTRFQGTLSNGYSVLDLVERLHPTPAVGGRPRAAALRWIRERERLDRGWYAGAVGWMDQNLEGEFAVAIRSALLHDGQATLFAGCGIVADSDPEREYAESALKLKPMLDALQE